MFFRFNHLSVSATILLVGGLGGTAALGQTAQTRQTLDNVIIYNGTKVLDMEFEDPARTFPPFSVFPVQPTTGTAFGSCANSSLRGLFCREGGTAVRHWPDPEEATGTGELVVNCLDPALGLRSEGCTAMTVGLSGEIWIVGRSLGSGFRLIKLQKKNGICPAGSLPPLQTDYCARANTLDRPPADISLLDGETGDRFRGPGAVTGPGVLGIQDGTSVVFYRDAPTTLRTLIADKSRLGLSGNETLQSVTLLQLSIADAIRNFALVTTTKDRILAFDTASSLSAFQVFNIATERSESQSFPAVRCNTFAQQYSLRASTSASATGRVYLTDRNFCQAVALEPVSAGGTFLLQNVQEDSDLTLSTASFSPDALTISPGIPVDLVDCAGTCTVLSAANGDPAATFSNVTLASDESDMVAFQIKGIPDCRHIQPTACQAPDVIVTLGGQQFLNVTPLLPKQLTLALPTPLPRLLIHPQFRAHAPGFTFDALFTVLEEGVVFTDTFDGLLDVGALTGSSLTCGFEVPPVAPQPNLAWDVVTRVSELWVAVGAGSVSAVNDPNRHVDTLMNTGCLNPTRIKGPGLSLIPYNLELTPNTDAVFGHLLVKLLNDFKATLDELACTPLDTGGTTPPLASGVCATLAQNWANLKDKFDKCFTASLKPKNSSGSQNCTSVQSQLDGLASALDAILTASGPDPANRLGDLKARHAVIQHMFDRYLDSIPPQGFTNL